MTDIDEVNDVIQETDEETYALDFKFTEEKEYKTVQKYELVTILSYLIGVRNEILDDMCSDEYVELLNSLREVQMRGYSDICVRHVQVCCATIKKQTMK